MTTIAHPISDCISTMLGVEYPNDFEASIDTVENTPRRRWLPFSPVREITTISETSADGNGWIEKTLPRLRRVADLPDNWDGAGSQRPNPEVVAAVKIVLERLRNSSLGAVPVPFVCPVAGGGVQFEWSSTTKHLEIEFIDKFTVAFLKEETTSTEERVESGDSRLADLESTRQLLEWFATV